MGLIAGEIVGSPAGGLDWGYLVGWLSYFDSKIILRQFMDNYPDFDSKKDKKQAAALVNKGVAAFEHIQEYVGENLISYCWPKYFLSH